MLSEAYGMKFRSAGELDFYLARTLTSRMAAQYPSINTFNPRNTDDNSQHSEGDFVMKNQTLLHWAAHNGFRDLASTLLTLGWTIYLNTPDSDQMLPHEIAERAGHTSLATFLRSHRSRMNQSESKSGENEEHISSPSADNKDKTGLDGYLIPNKIIDNTVHSVQQPSTKNNNNKCRTDNEMINNGLQSFILTRSMDQNGNIQLAATSQEYMGNNDIQRLQEKRTPGHIKIMDVAKEKYDMNSNYDIPRSLAVPFYNNINGTPQQDEDITTPTSDPFYLIPPTPRPYSNPPPTPDFAEVMSAVNLSLDKPTQESRSKEGDKIEPELDFVDTNDDSLQDADTRPASPCFNESQGDWKPPLPVIKPCISSPADLNPSNGQLPSLETCQLQTLATCQKPAKHINLQPGNSSQTIIATPQINFTSPQTKSVRQKDNCQRPSVRLESPVLKSPMFKSPLVPPRLRHYSNQERTNTPKIVPDSFRRSSTPVLRSFRSETVPTVSGNGDSEENTEKKKAAYIRMSGRKSTSFQLPKIPPPLGAFPIPKSGSFGSSRDRVSRQESSHLYQNVVSKELKEAAESIQKKPESRKDILAKLIQNNPTKIGTLPSIPSEGAINLDTPEDKEICAYLVTSPNRINEELPSDPTSKVVKNKNFFLMALENQDLDFDDGREFKSLNRKDSTTEEISATKEKDDLEKISATCNNDSTNDSQTERGNAIKAVSSGKDDNESINFPSQLKPFDARSRNDSGDQEKGKIKKLLGRLSPANFGRRSSRQKKSVEVEKCVESPFQPIQSTITDSEKNRREKDEITEVTKEDDELKHLRGKNVTKTGGELNIRRRTCSPCQIFKVSAPTPPPKLLKATTLPVSDMLTDYDIPRSLTNSRENLFVKVSCKAQPLTEDGKATFKVVETQSSKVLQSRGPSGNSTLRTDRSNLSEHVTLPGSNLSEPGRSLPPSGRAPGISEETRRGSNTSFKINRDVVAENKFDDAKSVHSSAFNNDLINNASGVNTVPKDAITTKKNQESIREVKIPISIATDKF